jgi:hypothetical protein
LGHCAFTHQLSTTSDQEDTAEEQIVKSNIQRNAEASIPVASDATSFENDAKIQKV